MSQDFYAIYRKFARKRINYAKYFGIDLDLLQQLLKYAEKIIVPMMVDANKKDKNHQDSESYYFSLISYAFLDLISSFASSLILNYAHRRGALLQFSKKDLPFFACNKDYGLGLMPLVQYQEVYKFFEANYAAMTDEVITKKEIPLILRYANLALHMVQEDDYAKARAELIKSKSREERIN